MQHITPSPSDGQGQSTFRENVLKEVLHDEEAPKRPAASLRHHAMARKRITKALTAVVFCLVLIFMLPTLCRSLNGKVTVAGSGSRRLAEGGKWSVSEDEELNAILDQCLDMEEEFARSGDGFFQQPEEKLDAAVGSTSLIPWMHGDATSDDFNRQELRATTLQVPVGSWSLAYEEPLRSPAPHLIHAGGGEDRVSSIAALTVGVGLPLSGEDTSGTPTSQKSPPYSQPHQMPQIIESQEEVGPRLQTGGLKDVLEGLTELNTQASEEPASGALPVNEHCSGQSANRAESGDSLGGKLDTANTGGSAEDLEQPLAAAAAPADSGAGYSSSSEQWSREMHAFIRLPKVPAGFALGTFDPVKSRCPKSACNPVDAFLIVHEIFAKESLTFDDLRLLTTAMGSLVCFALFRLGHMISAGHQAHLIRQLGISFMLLDAVVCGLNLMGVNMTSMCWWDDFISAFPTHYVFLSPRKRAKIAAWHNYKLGRHLLAALKVYKTGVRPEAREVLRLKRMLLCSPDALSYFKSPRWDPWRADDKRYTSAQVDSSDDSESGDESG